MQRYGGNTSCVVLEVAGEAPIILDLGTGLRHFGRAHGERVPFEGTALVSHLHWDHIQGLPFFGPVLTQDSRLEVFAPATEHAGRELHAHDAVRTFLAPPYFPVGLDSLRGEVTVRSTPGGAFWVGSAKVTTAEVPHCGRTLGYRIDVGSLSVAYVPDHQEPELGATWVDPAVLELVAGADLLIHDAQFDDAALAAKPDWGHCTANYAVHVAAQAEVRNLALFHHDPGHGDLLVDRLAAEARVLASRLGVPEVWAASEGLTVALTAGPTVGLTATPTTSEASRILVDR